MRSSTCCSDVVCTKFLKEVFEADGATVRAIADSSLATGIFPSSFKHAVVQPLLKKSSLDVSDLTNFRLISSLLFLSKV